MNLTLEQAEQLREFLANIFLDAIMLIDGDGDFYNGGFELIRDNAKDLYQELFELHVTESSEFKGYIAEKRIQNDFELPEKDPDEEENVWFENGSQIADVFNSEGVKVYEIHDTSESFMAIAKDGRSSLKTFEFEDDRVREYWQVAEAIEAQGFTVIQPERWTERNNGTTTK